MTPPRSQAIQPELEQRPFDTAIDFSRSKVARYLQLATMFRNRIKSGQWPIGFKLPNISQLAQETGVAKETIRQAADVLASEGLIERTRGRGTFVKNTPLATDTQNLDIDWNSLIKAHEGAELTVLDEGKLNEVPRVLGEGQPEKQYYMMRRLHSRDGLPYLVSTFYLDNKIFQSIPKKRFRNEPTLGILHEVVGSKIKLARQVLTVGSADVEAASRLGVPINSPVAEVIRYIVDTDGTLMYVGEGIYRGDSVSLEINLR